MNLQPMALFDGYGAFPAAARIGVSGSRQLSTSSIRQSLPYPYIPISQSPYILLASHPNDPGLPLEKSP